MAVALTAPAAFRFTRASDPGRHDRAAALLDPSVAQARESVESLPGVLASLMRDIGMPNGIAAVGYRDSDVPDLVDGAVAQRRLLSMAPLPVNAEDLAVIFRQSMSNW